MTVRVASSNFCTSTPDEVILVSDVELEVSA